MSCLSPGLRTSALHRLIAEISCASRVRKSKKTKTSTHCNGQVIAVEASWITTLLSWSKRRSLDCNRSSSKGPRALPKPQGRKLSQPERYGRIRRSPLGLHLLPRPEEMNLDRRCCYNSRTMHFELRCTGDHGPAAQRKKGRTARPSQLAKRDASVSSSAKGRLVTKNPGIRQRSLKSKIVLMVPL